MVKDTVEDISLTLFAIFEFIVTILFLPGIFIRDYRYSREHRNDEYNPLGSVRFDLTLIDPIFGIIQKLRIKLFPFPEDR